ncbi:hypothetical protein ABK905_05470 [Acerihabitans sp. KWT182]|uniref:Uncharacterized protein n=1 Tax=Acerihabitans sp. KWT182 TaxID=3157919 RepID=A0AAU7QC73_9GAMM
MLNNAGRLQAQNNVTLDVGSLTQQAAASLIAGGQLTVQADSADTDGTWQSQSLDYQGGAIGTTPAVSTRWPIWILP